jgi:hypothetical protein
MVSRTRNHLLASCTCDGMPQIPMLLVSTLIMNFSPSCKYPKMGVIHSNFFTDHKAASASRDHWKANFCSVSCISSFVMSTYSTMNLQ